MPAPVDGGIKVSVGSENNGLITLAAIDHELESLAFVENTLAHHDVRVLRARMAAEGWNLVSRARPQIVLLDLMQPGMGGMQLLERIVESDPGTSVLVWTRHYSPDTAVEAVEKGACDCLEKPVSPDLLCWRIDKLMAEAHERRHAFQLEHELLEAYRFEGMVGRSPEMLDVFARIRRVAPHYRTVLLTGATGTGKELVAQALHRLSPVAGQRLVVSNCSAIVETLFESELFGHVKGSFTGATQDRVGLFEYAQGGAVLLDEIGDMPLSTQSKLLRVLQNQEIQRVGSSAVRRVDVRILAATNRDLVSLITARQFREDLYYRLSMVEIKLPRLTERREDLPLLQRHFVERFSRQYEKRILGISRRAQSLLAHHSWPGNVRELENVVGHACMMAEREFIDVRDLPDYLHRRPAAGLLDDEELLTLAELERRHAHRVLERVKGNKQRAAQLLGISRATLYRLLRTEAAQDSPDAGAGDAFSNSRPPAPALGRLPSVEPFPPA